MKKLFFIVLIIIQYHQSSAQFSVKIINENFNSNMMRWDIHQNESSEMLIQDGKYLLSGLKEGTAITSTIDVPHIQANDYTISASFLKSKGIDDNGYGVVWGSLDANNEFEFVISGNGQFKIIKWELGNKSELFPWTYSSSINKWDFSKNILKILNQDHILRFYINENYIAAIKELPAIGNRVGFILNEQMNIEVDYLMVENLTNVNKETSDFPYHAELSKVEFQGPGSINEIKYNESAKLDIQIANIDNSTVNDLMIKIEPDGIINGLEFNQILMIDKINAKETKSFSVKFDANEEIASQNNGFNIELKNLKGEIIDSKRIYLKTIGMSTMYETNNKVNSKNNENSNIGNNYPNTTNNGSNNSSNNTNNKYKNNSMDGCAKGCAGAGLLSLLAGIILAII